ncbi:MAG: prephenate dehydrogenase [Dehalococcoidales bacterium]|nr:MAG: prephenate dehydrogenase [Dehalococcoidales bacterium]
MKVAIIGGSGKMGRWFADFLIKDGNEVIIIGRNEEKLLAAREQLGSVEATTDFTATGTADLVIVSVPLDHFEAVIKQLQPCLKPGQIVTDITSVKVFPTAIMHKYMKTGLVLGTHPVFGPGARDIRNQNFVLTPTSPEENDLAEKARQYLTSREARVTLMSPQEHDEMMAFILGLSHFIAIVSADTLLSFGRLKQLEAVSGSTYKVLLTFVESVISEDPELYASLQMNLPGITDIERLFLENARTWAEMVKSRNSAEFISRMNVLKEGLEKNDPDFSKAYQNMYRLLGK